MKNLENANFTDTDVSTELVAAHSISVPDETPCKFQSPMRSERLPIDDVFSSDHVNEIIAQIRPDVIAQLRASARDFDLTLSSPEIIARIRASAAR